MDLPALKKYHGIQSSIIALSSGYYLYLASWDHTPTDIPQFTNIWLVTPDDHRMLFSDPPDSSRIVCIYHDFDEIIGSSIEVNWANENHLQGRCISVDDLHKLEFEFFVKESVLSKILISIAGGPPTPFRVSEPMIRFSNFLVDRVIAGSGSVIVGVTETGQPFYSGDTERIYQITHGSVSYNDKNIGAVSKPTWPIAFGDAVPFSKPTIKLGTLHIPFEPEMLGDGA
jgi:hypothetical protein